MKIANNEISNETLEEMFKHDLNNHDYLKICEENHNCEVKKYILIIEDATRLGHFWSDFICFVEKSEKHNFPFCS